MNEPLKPCPFCGAEAILDMERGWIFFGAKEWKAQCSVCTCNLYRWHKSEEMAIKAWNRRYLDFVALHIEHP